MLIQLAEDLPAYFYEVFVTRFDFWLVVGIAISFRRGLKEQVQADLESSDPSVVVP